MNERIKELLKKATRRVDHEEREWVFTEVDQKKFAELIIRECGNFTDPVTRNLMMKHFGVKE
jgi:hypothetical protein